MNNSTIVVITVMVSAVLLIGTSSVQSASPPDGMYIGTTDQGREFELRVTGGRVDRWYINFYVSCQYGSTSGGVRSTISPSCVIEEDGSFVCGFVMCPIMFLSSEVGGVFSQTTR